MRVEILGTVGYHPTETRHTTCVFLPELNLAFDAGTSLFRLIGRCPFERLHIFLSHAHLDHVMGLTYFFSLTNRDPQLKVTVHGREEKLQAVREHLFNPHIFPVMPPYDWQPLPEGEIRLGEARIRWFPLEHPGGAVGYRLDLPGRSLGYVTDTIARPSSSYISQIRNVDLLLHECNFPDGHEELAEITGHSCLTPVVNLAATAGVKKLVLIHVDPLQLLLDTDLAAAQRVFPGMEVAHDRSVFEF